MPEFDVLGRDIAAAADSEFSPAVAGAVKALWAEAGFDQGENPNHLWTVSVDVQSDRLTVSATVKDGNVYVPPPYPDVPATQAELVRNDVEAAEAVDAPAEIADEAPVEAPVIPLPPPVDPAPPVDPVPLPEPDAPAA